MVQKLLSVAAVALVAGCVVTQPVRVAPPTAGESARASVGGKYEVLVATVTVPGDVRTYGTFHDYGYWPGGTYAGVSGIPPGYWVYVAPTWYVWKQLAPARQVEEGSVRAAAAPPRAELGAPGR
jgi:hypothetical protein